MGFIVLMTVFLESGHLMDDLYLLLLFYLKYNKM